MSLQFIKTMCFQWKDNIKYNLFLNVELIASLFEHSTTIASIFARRNLQISIAIDFPA